MPKREDELWAGQKGNLRYCSKHQRYYDAKIGCQICFLEEQNPKRRVDEVPRLQKCPSCNHKSLFWNKDLGLYECLNLACKKTFAKDQIAQKGEEEKRDEHETTEDRRKDKLKGGEKRGLCPFCGTSDIFEHYGVWKCRKCEKMFPSPSYGPGQDFGKEARWLGKSSRDVSGQDALSSEPDYPFEPDHVDYKGQSKTPWRKNLSPGKILLAFLILILLVGVPVAYTELSSPSGVHAPSGFTATPENMQITLTWNKKNNADQFLVRYKTASYPTSLTDGILLYEGNVTRYVHTNLQYGKTYYYGIWSRRVVNGQWEYCDKGAFASGTPYWRGPAGEQIQEYVEISGARLVGADGNHIVLFNNPEAHDPTWQELKQFLWQDTTDQHLYNITSFVCADFAEMLHNNAEKAGIRAAYVGVDLSGYSDPYNLGIPSDTSHALDAFNTTDKGLIYIDDTGTQTRGINADKTVNLVKGSRYIPVSIFPDPGYESQWGDMGTVTDIWIQW